MLSNCFQTGTNRRHRVDPDATVSPLNGQALGQVVHCSSGRSCVPVINKSGSLNIALKGDKMHYHERIKILKQPLNVK